MLRRTLLASLSLALLFSVSWALPDGDCSQFTATVSDSGETQVVTLDVQGADPWTLQFFAFGETPGMTVFKSRFATLSICLDLPFLVAPLGFAGMRGGVTQSFEIPNDLALTLHMQAIGVGFGREGLEFCTSNSASIDL